MQSKTFEQLLDETARACGIDPGYWDIWGRYHEIGREAKQSILRAMGIDARDAESLAASLARRTCREWERLAPPAIVAVESATVELPLHVPAESLGNGARLTIHCEDGGISVHNLHLWDLPQTGSIEMNGGTWLRKQAAIPVRLPLGYHDILVESGSGRAITRYIVTPERAFTPEHFVNGGRAAGLAISLYGIRSARNWGCGDFTDLMTLLDWVAD